MQKLFKNPMFMFILGVVLSCSVTSAFAYSIFASDIGFTPIDDEFKQKDGSNVTNVNEAIEALFNKVSRKSRFGTVSYVTSQGDEMDVRTVTKQLEYGKYLVIINYGNNWWNTNSNSAHGVAETNPLTCSSNNCDITPLSGYYNRIQPSYTKNGRYNYNSDFIFSYYVGIKEASDTISSSFNAGWSDGSDSQYITMTIISINE